MVVLPKRADFVYWSPWLLLLILSTLLQLYGAYPALRLDLHGPASHWAYQIFTCHLVHINKSHWLSDAFALIVIAILFHREFLFPCWLFSFLLSAVIISLGLLLYADGLQNYAGLSGLLHGLYVTGSLLLYRHRSRLAILLLALMAIKLSLEPILINHDFIRFGFQVATIAHVYGCLGGGLAWLGCRIMRSRNSA